MLLAYSKIVGLPVYEIRSGSKLGHVDELIYNNEDFSVIGFSLSENSFWQTKVGVISPMDIIHFNKDGIVINDAEDVLNLDEAIRIKAMVSKKLIGIHQVAKENLSQEIVGIVTDMIIDTQNCAIKTFCVRHLLEERLISPRQIESFLGKDLIIRDNRSIRSSAHDQLAEVSTP